jgi:hypothetical protein
MGGEVSDSEDDVLLKYGQAKRPALKRLPFGPSPAKNVMVGTQPQRKIRKPRYDPVSAASMLMAGNELKDKLRSDYVTMKQQDKLRQDYQRHRSLVPLSDDSVSDSDSM